jgi:hypothetical protein
MLADTKNAGLQIIKFNIEICYGVGCSTKGFILKKLRVAPDIHPNGISEFCIYMHDMSKEQIRLGCNEPMKSICHLYRKLLHLGLKHLIFIYYKFILRRRCLVENSDYFDYRSKKIST